jgi:hypothetical protein
MRQLRYVGPGKDVDHVILETPDADEQFVLFVDAAMRDAVRSDLPRLGPKPAEPPAAISPREIQMRVRGGASPQDIADANEMSVDRVLRFAGAVLEERSRVAQEARRARARRSTSDAQTVVFGDAVDMRFAAHGIEPSAVSWDSRRRADGQWIVRAQWLGGDEERVAEWAFHLGTRSVTPMDGAAADLLSDRPIRPIVPVAQEPERPSLAAAPPLAPGVVAFPTLDTRTDPLPTGLRDDITPLRDDVFDQEALDEDPRHVGAFAEADIDGERRNGAGVVAPPLPLRLAEPLPEPPAAEPAEPAANAEPATKVKNLGIAHREEHRGEREHRERGANGKPRVPSWDDILMGVRRDSD